MKMIQWNSAVEVSFLLGYGATSLGDHRPKFWDSAHLRGSNVKSWRWDNYALSKYWTPITEWHSGIFQKNVDS